MLKPKFIVLAVLALLLITLVIQNREVVTLTLLFWDFEISRVVLILLATMTGFIGGYMVARLTAARSKIP